MIFKKLFGGKQEEKGDYNALIQKGDWPGALKVLEAELAANPGNVQLILRKADCHEHLGQTDPAVAALEKAAQLYTEDGFVAKAIALQKKIAKLKPEAAEHTSKIIASGIAEKREEKAWQLKAIPSLFADFDRNELEDVIKGVDVRTFGAGEVLCREGDKGDSLLCITDGKVAVSCKSPSGEEIPLKELGPRDFFGEVGFLTGKPRTATVTAVSAVEVLEFTKDRLEEIIARYPHVQKVMDDFRQRRAQDTVNALIRKIKGTKA
jgi:tetratricopeptide (TPR) repeat protein